MDIIYISDLRIDTVIGVNEWERRTTQTLILDIEMAADIRAAAGSDDIADTLDYKSVAKRLRVTKSGKFKKRRAGKRHLLQGKSAKRKRQLRGGDLVCSTMEKQIRRLLPYGAS